MKQTRFFIGSFIAMLVCLLATSCEHTCLCDFGYETIEFDTKSRCKKFNTSDDGARFRSYATYPDRLYPIVNNCTKI